MSPLVQPLGPVRVVHGVPVQPVRVQLAGGFQLLITDQVPHGDTDRLAAVRGTLLYSLFGIGLRRQLTGYTGITRLLDGSRVRTSFRTRVAEMRPAGMVLLYSDRPAGIDFLWHLESAVLKRTTMRTRALNRQTSAREASARLARFSPGTRNLADALAQEIADAITVYGLGGHANTDAVAYRNARDHAAALIHRLGGRAVDTRQVVDLLRAAGAELTSLEEEYVVRRDLVQREPESGNARIAHTKLGGLTIYWATGVLTAAEAITDYTRQRQQAPAGDRLPVPTALGRWCPCPYCTPVTPFATGAQAASPSTRTA